ncbi:hypothetical protein A2572_01090 [Candidatus Collierbacteria bacterium RIFOXYD1_FULL_40_9]|uniref:DUF192 domain-containing protein n=1 Tax=Candidatus Collierbacteria bacterium RIFOXYD1_FULL_40_9 TaxID=1817731 RepID=A0A1F5FP44_9BACT|nr:MAG: hypothetical protein A2572_01090 [Candidatus Collierbacteria bacterium RIFOXYD1_FULL_40_9]
MTIKVKVLTSFFHKLFGLIDKNHKPPVLLITHFGIHTFFMRYPIDVLLLTRDSEVVDMKHSLKPFSFFFYLPIYSFVVELEDGFIKKNNIKIGDIINLEYQL